MNATQLLGIPIVLFGLYIFKWGIKDLKADKVDWYATVRDFGTAVFATLLGILMVFNKIEF